ncbi:MAG: metallophosphoesterase [Candidatus Aminicenantes bacterium]|nr:metallophosphoesterase [Candidatus Aminicenantes bacterium]
MAKKSSVTRRNFLKGAATVMATTAVSSSSLLSSNRRRNLDKLRNQLHSSEFPFAYDTESFDSSERVWFEGNDAWVNILPKPGKNLDIKLYTAETEEGLYRRMPDNISGVKDSCDIHIGPVYGPRLYYVIEYSDGKGWKSLAHREVKTPNVDLENGGKVKIIIRGDNHVYADLRYEPKDKEWRRDWLRGDYISRMMKEIIVDPGYEPEFVRKLVVEGFTYAHTLKYILETKPDLVIDVGDTVGPDSYGVWGKKGQWPDELQPEGNWEHQAKILWGRTRRTLAPISPEIPYYLVLGNHEGENGWEDSRSHVREQRERLLRLPKLKPVHFTPLDSSSVRTSISSLSDDHKFRIFPEFNGNHYVINWANGDVQFYALDPFTYVREKPEQITEWTLGKYQKNTLERYLINGDEIPWKFICFHHTVGGYPLGPGTNKGAYGRGPLFTKEDYEIASEMAKNDPNVRFDPEKVEQVWLTEMAKDTNVRGFFYGHDHVFFKKDIGKTSQQRKEYKVSSWDKNFHLGMDYFCLAILGNQNQ